MLLGRIRPQLEVEVLRKEREADLDAVDFAGLRRRHIESGEVHDRRE